MIIFDRWIEKYNSQHKNVCGKCKEATLEMMKHFPNLKRVRGFVYATSHRKPQEHWWCETPDGVIIDPTKKQFEGLIITYEKWDETNKNLVVSA